MRIVTLIFTMLFLNSFAIAETMKLSTGAKFRTGDVVAGRLELAPIYEKRTKIECGKLDGTFLNDVIYIVKTTACIPPETSERPFVIELLMVFLSNPSDLEGKKLTLFDIPFTVDTSKAEIVESSKLEDIEKYIVLNENIPTEFLMKIAAVVLVITMLLACFMIRRYRRFKIARDKEEAIKAYHKKWSHVFATSTSRSSFEKIFSERAEWEGLLQTENELKIRDRFIKSINKWQYMMNVPDEMLVETREHSIAIASLVEKGGESYEL